MPIRPLRRRSPYIGSPPRPIAPPPRRPVAALLVAAALPLPRPGAVFLSRTPRAAAAPSVPGSLRRIEVVGGRGRLILPIVPGTGAAVTAVRRPAPALLIAPPFSPRRAGAVLLPSRLPARTVRLAPFQVRALVVGPPKREPPRGTALLARLPARTVRLTAFQLQPLVIRRDERRGPGSVFLGAPHRPTPPPPDGFRQDRVVYRNSPAVLFNRGGRVLITPPRRPTPPVVPPTARVVRRDERTGRGSVLLPRVPARTVRLSAFELGPLVVRRDERRYAGAVLLPPPHRPTLRLTAGALTARVVPRPAPARPGAVLLLAAPRAAAAPPAPAPGRLRVVLVRREERRWAGALLLSRVPARTVRLAPPQIEPLVVRRDQRGFRGAVLQQRLPARTVRLIAPQLRALVVLPPPPGFRGAALVGRLARATPPPVTAGSLRRIEIVGGRGRLILPIVPGTGAAAAALRPGRPPLVVRPVPAPPRPMAVALPRVPARTVRLAPPQLGVRLVRRDERGFAGRVLIQPPTRTGAAAIVPRVPRLLVAAADRRGFNGRVIALRVLARTIRLAPVQTRALLVQRDQRGFGGQALFARRPLPVPVLLIPRPPLVVRPVPPSPPVRPVVLTRPFRFTLRLTAGPLRALIVQRAHPRPAGTAGAVLFVRRAQPRVVAPLPRLLVIRRDERGYPGRVLRLPLTRTNAVIVSHGNPRAVVVLRSRSAAAVTERVYAAAVTKRAGAGAVLVQRPGPAASVTLRRPSGKLTFETG